MKIAFFGDPHGDFSNIQEALLHADVGCAIFVGDFGLETPMHIQLKPLTERGMRVYFIHGNHEGESDEFYDHVFGSDLACQNISGKVVNVDGIRIAGLGGVFRKKIWNPAEDQSKRKFETRDEFLRMSQPALWRGGLPRRHRVTIFPEDFSVLGFQRSDILVSHEAPSTHEFGFRAIDALGIRMGAKLIVHGHHHESYRSRLMSGIQVVGLAKAEFLLLDTSKFSL